ncbi:MAG: type IV secretion system protein [Acetobacteraceae bacterium]|nr:type IV secretion system protein [Acetobacteraceae bacterium]
MDEPLYQDEFLRTALRRLLWLGISACGAIIALTTALLVLALRPSVPPYVVAVDHGKIVGYTQVFKGDSTLGEEIIEDKIREFIYDARVVSANREFEERNIDVVYAMSRGQAYHWLDDYYKASPDNDPIKLCHKGVWRDVNITRVLREETEGSYRVEWLEILHPSMGEPVVSSWEATLRVVTGPPSTRSDLNPLGIFIIAIDMQQANTTEARE